jgi:hypothetical protein
VSTFDLVAPVSAHRPERAAEVRPLRGGESLAAADFARRRRRLVL